MYISHQANGVCVFQEVGESTYYNEEPREEKFRNFVKRLKKSVIGIASLTPNQTSAIKFLKAKGFKQFGKPVINPNSSHYNIMFVKVFKKSVRKKKR